MTTKYEVTAVSARINSGVLQLTKEQAKPRMHCLKALKGSSYEVLKPVEFKRGEVFGYDGDLPKVLASALEAESKKNSNNSENEKAEAEKAAAEKAEDK